MTDCRATNTAERRAGAIGAGVLLGALGVREAARLRQMDRFGAQQRARQLGFIRVTAAVTLLVRPVLLPRMLGLAVAGHADGVARWLPRLVAVRELVLGIGALVDSQGDRDPLPALLTISAVDCAEAFVVLEGLRRRALPPDRAVAFAIADLGSASAVPVLLKRLAAGDSRR